MKGVTNRGAGQNVIQEITVTLPSDVKQALDELTRQESVCASDIVGQAVRDHLFLKKFRLLRDRLTAQAQSQGILTDQDVFDRVSFV